jgi:hypothetical protein
VLDYEASLRDDGDGEWANIELYIIESKPQLVVFLDVGHRKTIYE